VTDTAPPLADRDIVDGVLRHLDERERAIVVLHYFLGMPLTDVAATLGIPVGTVKSRLHRALGEMRVAIVADSVSPIASPVPGGHLA
jgi:RNA polymerase sigma-70 factor (ECF subfamily)